jgi:hypothetical protein
MKLKGYWENLAHDDALASRCRSSHAKLLRGMGKGKRCFTSSPFGLTRARSIPDTLSAPARYRKQ